MDEAVPIALNIGSQLSLVKNIEKVEESITEVLKSILETREKSKGKIVGGLLVVYGDFSDVVFDVEQMGENPFAGQLVTIYDTDICDVLIDHMSNVQNDGAILVNVDGQFITGNAYLVIRDLRGEKPPNTGTRHLAASAFSKRDDILSCFVLSETRNTVVKFAEGEIKGSFTFTNKPTEVKSGVKKTSKAS